MSTTIKPDALEKLQEMIKTQSTDGNWNYTPYMTGLLNGLLLAQSVITDDHEPEYRDVPDWCIDEQRISQIANRVHEMAKDKGWWDHLADVAPQDLDPRDIADKLLLIHSEISEAAEEIREGRWAVWYKPGREKPEGFSVEIADAMIRAMDLCKFLGVDLVAAMRLKIAYNATREHLHGGKRM